MRNLFFLILLILIFLSDINLVASTLIPSIVINDNLSKKIIKSLYKKKIKQQKINLTNIIIPKKSKTDKFILGLSKLTEKYSLKNILKEIKLSSDVQIHILPVKKLFFLPFEEYYNKWKKYKNVKIIILSKGVITLKQLYKKINNSKLLSKENKNVYTLRAPIVIKNNAGLVLKNINLHLAYNPGAPIICFGKLYIIKSSILTWDTNNNKFFPISKIKEEDYYLYGKQPPRPFILCINGGKIIIVSSFLKGLGFKGLFSSYGVGLQNWKYLEKLFMPFFNSSLYSYKGKTSLKLSLEIFSSIFKKQKKSSCILIGNTFEENYIGFYANNSDSCIILGNIFRNNYQYNLKSYNSSKNLIIAYNIFENAHNGHGILLSKYCLAKIFNNISIGNNGAGIMINNFSKSIIKNNLLMGNKLGGITVLESDNNTIIDNLIIRNGQYGIYIRNSINSLIKNNFLVRNIGTGVEVSSSDLYFFPIKKYYYHLMSSAWIEQNIFEGNTKYEIKTSNGALGIYKNFFKPISSSPFFGNINKYTETILNNQSKVPVIILSKGKKNKKTEKDIYKILLKIEKKILKTGNEKAQLPLGLIELIEANYSDFGRDNVSRSKKILKCGIEWIIKSASYGDAKSLTYFGLLLLNVSFNNYLLKYESLILLSEATILGDKYAAYILYLAPIIFDISNIEIEKAFSEALKRIIKKRLINCDLMKSLVGCCQMAENPKIDYEYSLFWKNYYILKSKDYNDFIKKYIALYINKSFENKINKIKERIKVKNIVFKEFFEWERKMIKKEGVEFLHNNPEIVKYVNKIKLLYSYWNSLLKKYSNYDFDLIRPTLIKRLKEINIFRSENMKLKIKEEINWYKEKYIENFKN